MFSAFFPDRPPPCSSRQRSLALFILTPVKGGEVLLSGREQEASPWVLGTQEGMRREKVTAGIC